MLEKETNSPVPYRKAMPPSVLSPTASPNVLLGPKPYVPPVPSSQPPPRQKLCHTNSNAAQQSEEAESAAKARNRRFVIPDPTALGDAAPPDIIPSEDRKNFGRPDEKEGSVETDAADGVILGSGDRDVDSLAIRKDNIRAVKRRSWADHASNDEAEHIRRVLCREQAKGRSINLSWIFTDAKNAPSPPPLNPGNPDSPVEKPRVTWLTEDPLKRPDTLSLRPSSNAYKAPEMTDPSMHAPLVISSSDDEATLTAGSESPSPPEIPIRPAPDKGILRGEGIPGSGRRIRFAPLALLLDAALEGELDLVKKSAEQVRG